MVSTNIENQKKIAFPFYSLGTFARMRMIFILIHNLTYCSTYLCTYCRNEHAMITYLFWSYLSYYCEKRSRLGIVQIENSVGTIIFKKDYGVDFSNYIFSSDRGSRTSKLKSIHTFHDRLSYFTVVSIREFRVCGTFFRHTCKISIMKLSQLDLEIMPDYRHSKFVGNHSNVCKRNYRYHYPSFFFFFR